MNLEWDRLKVFYYVAKERSISRAAERLGTFQPSVTRSIQQLEHQANSKLFIRNRKGLILTQQGEILFNHVKNMMTELELAQNQMSGKAEEIKGNLRVTATYGYTSTVLFKHICKFSKLYPYIKIQVKCNDNDLDLTKREADVAIRPFDPHASELEQTFLYERHLQLFASEGYIRDMGTPKSLNDLSTHRLICFDVQGDTIPHTINSNWISALGMEPSITVNSVECLAQAAEEGLGIITLSHDSSLIEKYQLLRILPDIQGPSLKAYYVYPTSIKNLQTVQWFGNYLSQAFINHSSVKDTSMASQE